jgi:hypothetical protein
MAADPFALANPEKTASDPFALEDKSSPIAAEPAPPASPFAAGVRGATAGMRAAGGGLLRMAGQGFGVRSLEERGAEIAENANADAAETGMRTEDINSIGGVVDFTKYALGNLLPYALTTVVLGLGGRALTAQASKNVAEKATREFLKNAGTVAGPAAFSMGTEAGSIFNDAMETGVDNPIGRAIAGGAAAGALDTAFPAFLMGKVLKQATTSAARTGFGVRRALDNAGKGAIKGGLFEGSTEGAQTFIERLAAGQALDGPEAASAYMNSIAVGTVGGGVAGGAVDGATTPLSQPAQPPAADPFAQAPAQPAAAPREPVQPAAPVQAAPAAETPLPKIGEMVKSEFPAIDPVKLEPATLFGRIEEVKSRADELDARITSLQSSMPSRGRAKLTAKKDLEVALAERSTIDQRLSNLNTLASLPDYQPKAGSIDNGVLVAEAPRGSPSIVTPSRPLEVVGSRKPGFMKSASELVEEGKVRSRAAAALEVPLSNTPRETIKAPDLKVEQEKFLERAGRVAESNVAALVEQGIVPAESRTPTRAVIYNAVKAALKAEDVESAKDTIRAGIERAVSRKLLKQDVDGFVDKVFAELAGEPAAVAKSATNVASSATPAPILAPAAEPTQPAAGDAGSRAAPLQLRDGVEGYREGGVWHVKQADARGIVTWPEVKGPNTIAEYNAVAAQNAPAPAAPDAPVERPAILTLGKVGHAPKSAEAVAIRANPAGGYDLYQGGYQVLDFNTAEPITYPPEVTTAQILADVKARSKDLFGNKQRFYEDKAPKQFNSQAAVDEHLRQVVGEAQDRFAEQGRIVIEALVRLLGPQKRLQIQTRPAAAGEPAGSIQLRSAKDVIAVATNAKDVLSVAYHEGFHYIEERLLSGVERRVLNVGLAPGTRLYEQVLARAKQYDYENKTDIAAEIAAKPQEAHAYGFEMWKRGELDARGMLTKVFAKIREFVERVKNMLGGMGFESVLDIYRAADAGAYRTRTAMDNATSDTLYSEGSTAFKEWFGDSKVVDKDGKPLVVYHGTPDGNFESFAPRNGGVFFTDNPDLAGSYIGRRGVWMSRGEAPTVVPAYLALQNPLVIDAIGKRSDNLPVPWQEWKPKVFGNLPAGAVSVQGALQYATARGHDGLIVRNVVDTADVTDTTKSTVYVVLAPEQIKSAIGNVGTYDPANPNILFSSAALADQAQLMADGQIKPQQLYAETSKFLEGVDLPKPTFKQVMGIGRESITGSVKRWYLENIASGTFIARDSKGFGNVFAVLTGHKQRKDFLIAQGVDDMLSKWDNRRGATQADIEAVGNALFKRTEGAYTPDSADYQALLVPLTPQQREMFTQANAMIADRLQQEFTADQRAMASLLGPESPQYAEWLLNRETKVKQLIEQGYVPERRYGDHVVHVTVQVKDKAGNPKPLTLVREQFETEAEARARQAQYDSVFEGDAAFKPAYEYKYAAKYDGSLSYQQFLDMARRQGIELTQAERERMARAMVSSDSVRNNRIFRRSNVPGYSKDVYRVLSEFAVTMANKIAYSEFSDAINSAAQGNEVKVMVKQGQPTIDVARDTDLWAQDGEYAGFYRNVADQRIDFVMQRDPGGDWSRNARAAASVYFLGGSMAAGMVQLSSLPMNTVPYLTQHTGYTNAFGKVLSAFKDVTTNFAVMRDIARLKDTSNVMEAVDSIPGLRQALIEAAQDGTVLDTEIYHIMGTTRGGMLSKSPRVQRAMDVWMAPFRMGEQVNRFSTFIAAYKVGVENNLTGNELYTFAQESVYNTQFRYDEANRPALAQNPIWAILFTFKSYPIFMSEMIVTMFRANPRAGVVMLLSLTAAAGVNGLPFADDLMDLIDTISQRIFGSPFNSKRAMRNMLKSASEAVVGADMSGLVMNGIVNEMTGLSFASRVGLGNMIPGTRAFTADADYKRMVEEVVGPVASMVGGAVGGAIALTKGHPIEALREAAPLAMQNVMKGVEQFQNGYATDRLGRKLIEVNNWEAFVQLGGFSSANLAAAYDMDRIDRQTQAFYKEVQKDFSRAIVKAVQSGDREAVNEAYQAVVEWNTEYPDMPMVINGASLRRQIAEAGMPINERTLKLLPRALRSQSMALEARGR